MKQLAKAGWFLAALSLPAPRGAVAQVARPDTAAVVGLIATALIQEIQKGSTDHRPPVVIDSGSGPWGRWVTLLAAELTRHEPHLAAGSDPNALHIQLTTIRFGTDEVVAAIRFSKCEPDGRSWIHPGTVRIASTPVGWVAQRFATSHFVDGRCRRGSSEALANPVLQADGRPEFRFPSRGRTSILNCGRCGRSAPGGARR